MTGRPEIPSPFRRVEFPPWPDDGIIPGASAEAVMGLSLSPEFPAGQSAAERMAAIIDHYIVHGVNARWDEVGAQILAVFEGPHTGLLGPLGITPHPTGSEPVTTEQPEPRGTFGQPTAPGGFLIPDGFPRVPEPRGAFGQLAQLYAPLIVGTMTALTEIRKMSVCVPITTEMYEEAREIREGEQQMLRLLNGTATPEERAQAAARRAAWQADRDRRHAAAVTEWEQLRARYADQPAVTAVLDIHQPTDRLECAHPVFGYEADAEDWPCSTFEAIKEAPEGSPQCR